MLRVAILSRWHVHAEGYANEFKSRPDVKLTAVWDEEPDKGQAFAKSFGIDFEPDLDALLAREDVDAVCVNAPTNMHRDVIIKAAKAGKHIFTEKVLAPTAIECADIRAAIEQSGVKFCISFPHRTFPHNLFAKKVLDDGLLGEVSYVRMRNAHNGASAGWLPAHFYDEVQCCGGAMMDLGAHPMYLIAWLLGKPSEISSAFTYITGHAVEDNAVSVMKYSSGAVAVSETGFVTGHCPTMLEIYGTEGSVIVTGSDVRFISAKNGGEIGGWVMPNRLPNALPDAITQFVEGVLYDKEIIFGIDDAVLLTELMDAAYRTHKQGGFVKV
ncbi:MAG: Gfo/Idh/MocA family oxidoreductase [Defluviitaleaceae bacterium]|nr:Gfo/Idh/MocA family oxidoreductase [Defluviitaleaceae bacterium]